MTRISFAALTLALLVANSAHANRRAVSPAGAVQAAWAARAAARGTWVGNRPARHDKAQPTEGAASATISTKAFEPNIQTNQTRSKPELPLVINPTKIPHDELIEMYEDAEAWGMHTVINLDTCNPETIRSAEAIHDYVNQLCALIKMKQYGDPRIVHFGECEEVAGYTLDQLIETSNVMGHFANQTNHAYLDIFSCKPYSAYEAVLFTKEFFGAVEAHAITMLR